MLSGVTCSCVSGSGVSPGSQPCGYRATQAPRGQASQEAVFLVTAAVDSQAPAVPEEMCILAGSRPLLEQSYVWERTFIYL